MRAFISICLLLLPIAFATTNNPQPALLIAQTHVTRPKVSLELGSVDVWLGMLEDEALLKFQKAGYQVLPNSSTEVRKLIKNENHIYSVEFKNGRLTYAVREWYSSGTDEIDAVLGALSAMTSHGAEECSINHDTLSNPDESADRILIYCGERSVLLVKGKSGSLGKDTFVRVAERIGQTQ